jgi:hypothetical protein
VNVPNGLVVAVVAIWAYISHTSGSGLWTIAVRVVQLDPPPGVFFSNEFPVRSSDSLAISAAIDHTKPTKGQLFRDLSPDLRVTPWRLWNLLPKSDNSFESPAAHAEVPTASVIILSKGVRGGWCGYDGEASASSF